jgi:hypothetical protein
MAFGKAVEILSGQSAASLQTRIASRPGKAPSSDEEESGVTKIARKLGVHAETVTEIYSEAKEGGVELVVGVGKLDTKTAAATKQLALLVSGGRQLAEGIDQQHINAYVK